MIFAEGLALSAGWWVTAGLSALLLLSVCAGFVAGVLCAPVFQEWGLKRAARHMQRVYELTACQLEVAGRMCRMLGDFTTQELTTTQWDRLERARTNLIETWQLLADRQRPPAQLDETIPAVITPSAFHVEWQRSTVDSATQLPDRAAFEANLDLMMACSRLHGQPSGLLLVRMDKCDQLQKRFGADPVARLQAKLATVIVKSVRDEDLVCRLQPDVFAVLIPSLSPIAGSRVADAVRSAIRQHPFRLDESGPECLVTASLGYACCLPTEPATLIVDRAGEALSKSQAIGRNQLHVHDATRRSVTRVG
ncbi:MAG: diguanylate cyclase [Planctomycetaceae bacterium]|nr:diguanylate cyclase [Planctomycetaceae bacterium]